MEKRLIRYIAVTVLMTGLFLFPNISIGQEEESRIIGEIIEISQSEHIIQVGNRNYIVTAVFIDDGTTEEPVPGFFRNLEVSSIVEVYVGDYYEGFWKAKKVIIFTGDKKEEILKEMDSSGG